MVASLGALPRPPSSAGKELANFEKRTAHKSSQINLNGLEP